MAGAIRAATASAARRRPSRGSRPRGRTCRHRSRAQLALRDPAAEARHPLRRERLLVDRDASLVLGLLEVDLELLLQKLPAVHLGVEPALLEERAVVAAF